MRMVPSVCRSLWLAMLIAALPHIAATAKDITLPSLRALRPPPPAAASEANTDAKDIVRPRDSSAISETSGDASPNATKVFARWAPRVRSFALLPRPDKHTAHLRIEFSKDVRLPREFDLQLDKKRVRLRLSDKNVTTIPIAFDVDSFLQEQAARSEFARRGALVPVFSKRHFKGFDRVKFLDPEQVRTAIRLKRFIPLDCPSSNALRQMAV